LKKIILASVLVVTAVSGVVLLDWQEEGEGWRGPASVPANYQALSGCAKQEALWDRIQESEHKELPAYRKFGALQLLGMSRQELGHKGSHQSDFAPKGWKKYLHRRGSIAKVKIVPRRPQYSGVFAGADCALLRLSLTYRPGGSRAVAPGLALKVLRDGVPSANVSALVSLDGQEKDYNFFRNPMSNIVPTGSSFGQKMVHRVFRKVSRYPEELVLEDMAAVDARGRSASNAVAPRQLFFVPTASVTFSADAHDVREDFAAIPAGTVVYELHALPARFKDFDYSEYTDEKVQEFLRESEHVADIVTTSEFVASEFGDDGIFFRHQLRP
jgi:hypothetical protein